MEELDFVTRLERSGQTADEAEPVRKPIVRCRPITKVLGAAPELGRSILAAGQPVAWVKFSNLAMEIGSCRLNLLSVAAVAARWVDRLQFLEVDLSNSLQLLRQSRAFEAGRQVVEPSAIFVL
jgi:hypothetical protein